MELPDEALVEGPELTASWFEIKYRGFQAGDRFPAGQLVYLEPHSTAAAMFVWKSSPADAEEALSELRSQLETARSDQCACLIVAPIQAGGPDHWTALTLLRQHGDSHFQARHFDSLSAVHAHCRTQAEETFACLTSLGVQCSQAALPPTELPVHQGDGWSCGWQTANRFEEAYRQFRGEGAVRCYWKKGQRRQETNRFSACLKSACWKPPVGVTSTASAASSAPPPAAPPAAEPPLGPSAQPLAASEYQGLQGCSRCRFSQSGCLSCNPIKAMRYAWTGSQK